MKKKPIITVYIHGTRVIPHFLIKKLFHCTGGFQHDLAPYGRDDLHVEGAGKVWREVEDSEVKRVVADVVANGCGKDGGELLDTRMLGQERAPAAPTAPAPGAPKPSRAGGVKIKLKVKK